MIQLAFHSICTCDVVCYNGSDVPCKKRMSSAHSDSDSTDEVGALVLDVGSYSSRAGYAGEDTPKVQCVDT